MNERKDIYITTGQLLGGHSDEALRKGSRRLHNDLVCAVEDRHGVDIRLGEAKPLYHNCLAARQWRS